MYTGRRRPRGPAPSPAQITNVADDVISTLKSAGVEGCFVGGMACKLFGNPRQPNDLDILCLTSSWEQEALKRRLVELNSRFYLVPSRDPLATYKVLWYHLFSTDSCVKVDLLFPGVLDIPHIPLTCVDRTSSSGLPCAPLSLVLLLKIQAWTHHGESSITRFRLKQPMDARDINELLPIARRLRLRPRSDSFLPETFLLRAELRVEKFVDQYPLSMDNWKALGYDLKPRRDKQSQPIKVSFRRTAYVATRLQGR